MSEFIAYSDETEVHTANDLFLMGGYVAPKKDWRWMEAPWQERVLNGPPRIPYMHVREINDSGWRAVHGVSYNEAQNRLAEASRIMNSFGNAACIISAMRRSEMEMIFNPCGRKKKYVLKGLEEPDYICFVAYVRLMLAQVKAKWPEATKLHLIISEKKGISEHISIFKESMDRVLTASEGRDLLGELRVGDMKVALPLQAADVLMWHVQRYYRSGQSQTRIAAPVAHRLSQLIQDGDLHGIVHIWTKSSLENFAQDWNKIGWMP